MNFGLIHKSLRETWFITLICGLGLALFEALVVWVFWNYEDQLTREVMEIEFIGNLFSSLLGSDLAANFTGASLRSIAWVHPLVLAILWTHEIAVCTRIPAGEIERGTIDILFGLPVSRWSMFLSETAVWLATGLALVAMLYLGNYLGHRLLPLDARPDLSRALSVAVNLYAFYFAVGALALLLSALSDRRGRAIGATIGILLVQFVWSFLEPYWPVAQDYAYLSILNFYKPAPIFTEGGFPLQNTLILLAIGSVLWAVAGWVFCRRNICTL